MSYLSCDRPPPISTSMGAWSTKYPSPPRWLLCTEAKVHSPFCLLRPVSLATCFKRSFSQNENVNHLSHLFIKKNSQMKKKFEMPSPEILTWRFTNHGALTYDHSEWQSHPSMLRHGSMSKGKPTTASPMIGSILRGPRKVTWCGDGQLDPGMIWHIKFCRSEMDDLELIYLFMSLKWMCCQLRCHTLRRQCLLHLSGVLETLWSFKGLLVFTPQEYFHLGFTI